MKVKVKCIKHYNDLELKEEKFVGNEYIVSKERANLLKEHNVIEIIEVIEEEKKEKTISSKSILKKTK